MTLVQLAHFVRIAELQSLSKAAAIVRIAQPALSRQVRNLERELGADLLVRHAWGVSLTPAGEVLLARARRLLAEADDARDAVNALSAQPSGRVALGVPTSVATTLLPPLAAGLREAYPRLQPYFVDGFSAALHARTLSGELDLALLYEDRSIGPLATAPLLDEALMIVAPAGGRSDGEVPLAAGLAGQTLIIGAHPNRLRRIVDEALGAAAGPERILEVDSLSATIAMVEGGLGLTLLPYSAVARDVARGAVAVQAVSAPAPRRTLLLARPVDRPPTPAVTAVETTLRTLVETLAPELRWRPLGRGGPK